MCIRDRYDNLNQFTHFVNDIIIPQYGKPEEVMIIEVDHIFRKDQIEKSIKEFRSRKLQCATTRQIEIWKGFKHRVPERINRCGVNFWNLRNLEKMPKTLRQGNIRNMHKLSTFVYNLGFAVSERTMYWKHLTALAYSKKIKDLVPNEDWYENKWLNWNEDNNYDLEISKGKEYLIPKVVPYNFEKELLEL